jgi:hypothetical protein
MGIVRVGDDLRQAKAIIVGGGGRAEEGLGHRGRENVIERIVGDARL